MKIHENLILSKEDKVNTNTSWNQFLMALDVVSGKYHILKCVLKEIWNSHLKCLWATHFKEF